MIKEITLAIALGALLGFGITGSYLASRKSKKALPITQPTPTLAVEPDNSTDNPSIDPVTTDKPLQADAAAQPTTTDTVTITSPKDESIVGNSLLEITGTASPKSQIIVNTALKHYQTSADEKGDFKIEIDLESGLNNIQVDAFDQNDNQSSVIFQVTYSTAKI